MKQLRFALTLLALALALGVSASAAVTQFDATALDVRFTVSDDGSYTAVMTAALSFDGADTSIELPLGANVSSAEATGYDSRLRQDDDGSFYLTLTTDQSFVVPGSYTVAWSGNLPFTSDEETGVAAAVELLSAHWPGAVSNVTFTVTMPAAVAEEAVLLESGYYGELAGDAAGLTVSGTSIKGVAAGPLLDHESLLLRLSLPAGYFTEPDPVAGFFAPGRLVVPLLAALCLLYWFFTLRSPRTRCRPQMLPPDGVCAGDVPFLLYGARPEAALTVVQWASLGYLSLHAGRRAVRLERHMGMGNERKGYERRLFAEIFGGGGTAAGSGAAFRRRCASVERPLAAHWSRRIFDRHSGSPALLRIGAAAACAVSCGRAGASLDPLRFPGWLLTALCAAAGFGAGLLLMAGCRCAMRRTQLPMTAAGVAALLAMLLFGGLTGVRVGMVLACALALFAGLATASGGRRTRPGSDMLARLRSLRRFLSSAEPKQLRRLLRQDPQYYYQMLPFAEALGIGKAFSARFGSIRLEPCAWYRAETVPSTAPAFYAQFHDVLRAMRGA